MMTLPIPRLHMGCGEALRSHWLLRVIRVEQSCVRKTKRTARQPERTRE